jgi:hypothetical protein
VNRGVRRDGIFPVELRTIIFCLGLAFVPLLAPDAAIAQQQPATNPESTLAAALSAACRQDPTAFANFLTTESAFAYRSLTPQQRTGIMKRFVLLDDPGKPLLSSSSSGHAIVRCDAPGLATEMRLGETRVRENLAFVPLEIPLPNEPARAITFGLVREGGEWKLLSMGLLLLDIPSLAKQWEEADLGAQEDNAIANLRSIAAALDTYRRGFGKLPDSLDQLGPAAKGEISPDTAGLLDADVAGGNSNGYTFRYSIVSPSGSLAPEDADKTAGYNLAATPEEYGKTGKRSFFLDATGVLRGDDKQGQVATSHDPPIDSAGVTHR